ncbi:hypothetical protein TRFO_07453 [Tritrichomonas foetus]|uniref:Uncharacterized protein n=1 Tax=Tritrichomonas foetus TaxID=1144522 RepID=A0A1J4JQW9_9EUKA|nr:hypothetical protein TRFO_07453 [Tritrichomonas foetus]|eukprot:OHT01575.1 hypothetical protein TRFO_07453 [Tritrichomonas foetus]
MFHHNISTNTCNMEKNTCNMEKNTCNMKKNTCNMEKNTCNMEKNTYNMEKNTCNMGKNTCNYKNIKSIKLNEMEGICVNLQSRFFINKNLVCYMIFGTLIHGMSKRGTKVKVNIIS